MSPYEKIKNAVDLGINKKIMFLVAGGIGDRVCAEPVLRYALNNFKDVEISLACETPSLFSHLDFKEVFDFHLTYPIAGRHLILETYPAPTAMVNQYLSPNLMSTVDYSSLCALRCIIPKHEKRIKLAGIWPTTKQVQINSNHVLLHVGKSWESRTFPVEWWNSLILLFARTDLIPVLIGNNTLPVDSTYCLDLRENLSLGNLIWACKYAHSVITNDSSPVHIAASGSANIAFIPTVRRPDYLMHERAGGFGWKTMPFYQQRYWELLDSCPNHLATKGIDKVIEGVDLKDFLPKPKTIIEWITSQ